MSATPSSYYTAFIRGDSCLPQTGPVSKSFAAVRGMDRVSSRVLWSLLFSSWNNPHARVAHLGVSCPEPHYDPGVFPPEASPCHEQVIELCVFLHLPILFFLPLSCFSFEVLRPNLAPKKHKGSPQQRPLKPVQEACLHPLCEAEWRPPQVHSLHCCCWWPLQVGNRYPGDTSLALELPLWLKQLRSTWDGGAVCLLSNRLISHIKRNASCISGFWKQAFNFFVTTILGKRKSYFVYTRKTSCIYFKEPHSRSF